MNPQYIDIIIFGAIAVFFVLKLVKSLGTRPDGQEENTFNKEKNSEEKNFSESDGAISDGQKNPVENVLVMPLAGGKDKAEEKSEAENDELKGVFYKIYSVDNSFHPDRFLEGAKAAFAMIIDAFGKDDEDTLKSLVDEKVFSVFKKVLDGYKEKGQKLEQTLIGIKDVKIEKASLEGNTAKLGVVFETEQAKVVKDAEGNVIEGDSVMISKVKELWTFSRNLKNSNPDWTLVSVKGC